MSVRSWKTISPLTYRSRRNFSNEGSVESTRLANRSRRTLSNEEGSVESNASAGRRNKPGTTVFRVIIPDGIGPGQEFQVHAGNRIVRVCCPPDAAPGQPLQITVPVDSIPSAPPAIHESDLPLPPDSPNVERVGDDTSGNPAYLVTIPPGISGGEDFYVTIRGQPIPVTAPANARPGQTVRVEPPVSPASSTELTVSSEQIATLTRTLSSSSSQSGSILSALSQAASASQSSQKLSPARPKPVLDTQLFEVQVPLGVQPGQSFALLASGVRVLVTCPLNAGPGQRIRFKMPLALTQANQSRGPLNEAAQVKLLYDKDGWTRTIRVSDMKFQWVRMDDRGDVDSQTRFNVHKSAYVRKLDFRPGPDARIRDGMLSLVPAVEASCESRIRGQGNEDLVTYAEIATAQVKNFEEKTEWFQQKCKLLAVDWDQGHMRINVHRSDLLENSVNAVMSLSRRDLRKMWRFEFIGEPGLDAGGLAREWFQLVTENVFNGDCGLWQSSEANQMCMQINAASEIIFDDFLVYYRFLGRVMGKALFDRQLVAGHMVQYLYKHILGWPVMFRDLEMVDEEYYNNLKQLQKLHDSGEDLSMLCLNFSTTQEIMGAKEEVELVVGGKDIEVTNDNFPEYMEACMKYRLLEKLKPQLNELLLGFFDVIPESLLTVFDFQELELLMCGLPNIDMEDWKANTDYSGLFENVGGDFVVCQWFWEVVEEFDHETKARLLQFVTGTSGVPSRGFGVLQSYDGNTRKFTIHGVSMEMCLYPRSHTCFNRLDLPVYESKDELREKLKLAVTMVATGFDLE